MPNKADGYHHIIEDLKSQAEVWNNRAAVLTRIAKAFISYTDRLKYTVKMACLEMGVEELVGNDFKWKLVNNAPSLIIDNDGLIPAKFKEVVQTTKLRSDLIKEALKNGEVVPGAKLVPKRVIFGSAEPFNAACSSTFRERAPNPPLFIGVSTWMSRTGCRPKRLGIRSVITCKSLPWMSSGVAAGMK